MAIDPGVEKTEKHAMGSVADKIAKKIANAGDEYMPGGPPMSPLTISYFFMWSLFDVRFGSSRETMGTIDYICLRGLVGVVAFVTWLYQVLPTVLPRMSPPSPIPGLSAIIGTGMPGDSDGAAVMRSRR